jgi:cytochrome c oxidase assembly protein subunit 15
VNAWTVSSASPPASVEADDTSGLSPLLKMSLLGMFVLILSGSYMVGKGYGSSCSSWPMCLGAQIPGGEAYAIHMSHRVLSALVGLVVFITAIYGWVLRARRPGLGPASVAMGAVFLAQVLVGAATVWTGFSTELRATHLAMATLSWVALVLVAALIYVPIGAPVPKADSAGRRVAGLGEVAP